MGRRSADKKDIKKNKIWLSDSPSFDFVHPKDIKVFGKDGSKLSMDINSEDGEGSSSDDGSMERNGIYVEGSVCGVSPDDSLAMESHTVESRMRKGESAHARVPAAGDEFGSPLGDNMSHSAAGALSGSLFEASLTPVWA